MENKFKYALAGIFVSLLMAFVIWNLFIDNFQENRQKMRNIQNNVTQALTIVEKNLRILENKIQEDPEQLFKEYKLNTPYPYYIFKNGEILYWSDFHYVPTYINLAGKYDLKYLQVPKGNYIVQRRIINKNGDVFEIFQMLPIYHESKINNEYVSSGYNEAIFSNYNVKVKETQKASVGDFIVSFKDYPLLAISFMPQTTKQALIASNNLYRILLVIAITTAIFLTILVGKYLSDFLLRSKLPLLGFLLFLIFVAGIRAIMLYFQFPQSILPMDLFNGKYYASSFINPSLGDLLLNVIGLGSVIWYFFQYPHHSIYYRRLMKSHYALKLIYTVCLVILSFSVSFIYFHLFKVIFINSQWTLDITKSIDFSPLKIIMLVIMVINASIYFSINHFIFRTLISLCNNLKINVLRVFGTGAAIAILAAYALSWQLMVVGGVNLIYFLVVYMLNLTKHLYRIGYVTFVYLFISAITSGIIGSYAAFKIQQINTIDSKQKFANQLLIENDLFGEFLLSQISSKIKDDIFIQNKLFEPYSSKEIIQQKVKRHYFNSYFDKFNIDVYLYNANGVSLKESYPDFDTLKKEVATEQYATDYSNLYFLNPSAEKSQFSLDTKRYFQFINMKRYGVNIGNIVIDLKLKRFIPNSVYPELLVDQRQYQSYTKKDYNYAVFKDGKPTYSTGNYNYGENFSEVTFKKADFSGEAITKDNYHHLIVKGKEKHIIISSEAYTFRHTFANFSFLFLLFVFAIFLILMGYAIYFSIKRKQLNFATKIQLYLNAAFFLPLIAVSITTLSVISSSYKRDVNKQYLQKAENISSNIASSLDNYNNNQTAKEGLSNSLSRIAKFAESDVNLFNVEGRLIISSQPLIYDNDLLSNYINPYALTKIREEGNSRLILNESIGSLNYKSSYIGVKSFKTGELQGILSIPFFESQTELDSKIIEVVTNIMIIFTIIFIIFLIISYLASNILTYPLRYITQKIKQTTLAGHNEPLHWKVNDEIGLMVGEYNKMLLNLEASKAALSRSEKESAWREMARQVAHEIKNPLTPMKLNLQHLQRLLNGKDHSCFDKEEVDAFKKPINNLLNQVDTLSEIASSFSSFAKMPIPKNEVFNLEESVKQTVSLYQADNEYIQLSIEENDYSVRGDQQLMGRIISNLLINAQQSIPQTRNPDIKVNLRHTNSDNSLEVPSVLLSISDNGTGIAPEIQDKVFVPNFSNKYAGSGIGLAIAKRGITHAGGKIWFDSEEDVGTTFFIELPLILSPTNAEY